MDCCSVFCSSPVLLTLILVKGWQWELCQEAAACRYCFIIKLANTLALLIEEFPGYYDLYYHFCSVSEGLSHPRAGAKEERTFTLQKGLDNRQKKTCTLLEHSSYLTGIWLLRSPFQLNFLKCWHHLPASYLTCLSSFCRFVFSPLLNVHQIANCGPGFVPGSSHSTPELPQQEGPLTQETVHTPGSSCSFLGFWLLCWVLGVCWAPLWTDTQPTA